MKRYFSSLPIMAVVVTFAFAPWSVSAQTGAFSATPVSLTWEQVRSQFETNNPALRADTLGVDELKAAEVTAFLRPNPQFTINADGTQFAPHNGAWQPVRGEQVQGMLSYLHERERKRNLRQQSAKEGTEIASAQHEDLKRNLEFNLRAAFVATLQAKATLLVAQDDLAYYDKLIAISRDRYRAGDIAQIDLDRIELLRVQYEAELQASLVNLRTAKIQLLQLLNSRTSVEAFDVQGNFDFSSDLKPLDDFRQMALDERPDLRAALAAAQQAQTNHKLAVANGSNDPTLSAWYTWNPSFNNPNENQSLGLGVSIPLRIFDRNQGEKQRTRIDMDRSKQLSDATRAQVFSDVDSAYTQVESNIVLLRPYKEKYREQALRVRDTITYSYEHGGASLLDFLNAQSDYRQVKLAYVQLIGSYLTAAGQLNLAVGREVLQ
jgi:cobalt-zinc-cadmium efflux system outer membrane protein